MGMMIWVIVICSCPTTESSMIRGDGQRFSRRAIMVVASDSLVLVGRRMMMAAGLFGVIRPGRTRTVSGRFGSMAVCFGVIRSTL